MPNREQARASLKLANAARAEQAGLKRQLKSGELVLSEAFTVPGLQNMTVWDVVGYAAIGGRNPIENPKDCRHRARQALEICRKLQVSQTLKWGQLTERQRLELIRIESEIAAKPKRGRRFLR